MGGSKVMIVAMEGHSKIAQDWQTSLQQHWPSPAAPTFRSSTIKQLDSQDIADADAVILIAGAPGSQSAMSSLLDLIDEAGIAAIALIDLAHDHNDFLQCAGALLLPASIETAQLCATLSGMLHRQNEVRRLHSELSLNQRFHGGLKGEIAKMHEELQLAAMVQREFLPRELPSICGVQFAAMWRPTNYVSGDIFDLIRLDEDRVGVFIADAVGHGVPAALMTMVICRSLITQEIEDGIPRILSPSEVLARLNEGMIQRQGHTTRFATAVYAVVDCRRRTVQLAGGGHPAPLRLSVDGATHSLETNGGLLGVFADEVYDQIEFDLEVDDRLLFYTDGFEQAFPASANDLHHRRLPTIHYRHEFDRLRLLPNPTEMIDEISRRLDDQIGSLHQIDDLTMVCIHAGTLVNDPDGASAGKRLRAPASGGLKLAM